MSYFKLPEYTYIGENALKEAVPYLRRMGHRAFVVTGPHVGRSSMMDELTEDLTEANIPFYVYCGITGEPTEPMIAEGVSLCRKTKCDFVIGIGGGSPLDAAKAIAVMSVNEGSIADYCGKPITGKALSIVAIPTTAGTGSEATKFTIITDPVKDVKMLLYGEVLLPSAAILNAKFSMDMPKSVTACTGLDALTHAVEAYTSRKAFSLTDTLAVSAVRRILTYLPKAYGSGYDKDAREEMMLAAFEAGVCINNSSVTIVHGMSRPIGALFHVPHGMSNAMLLTTCLNYVMDGAWNRFGSLARKCGAADPADTDEDAAKKLLLRIAEVIKICEIPTLKEYGVPKEEFETVIPKMASDAMASGSPSNSWKELTAQDLEGLYKKVYV